MADIFQIKLSAREIIVLSALLGYESVFGIEDEAFLESGTEMKAQIRQTVQCLEGKKLIRYDLDGTLYILPQLRKAVECVCSADTVGMFSSNMKCGKKATVYLLHKDRTVATVEQTEKGEYTVQLSDTVDLEELVPRQILTSKPCHMCEMMLFEEAQHVRQQTDAFDSAGAEAQIRKCTSSDSAAHTVAKILSGGCGYMNLQIYRKNEELYDAVYSSLLVTAQEHTVALRVDDNNVLHFDAVSADDVIRNLRPYLT